MSGYIPNDRRIVSNPMFVSEFVIEDENGDQTKRFALSDGMGFIVTYMELLEILDAIHEFYDVIGNDQILEYNEAKLNRHDAPYSDIDTAAKRPKTKVTEQKNLSGYVYLINAGEFYKIGISKNVDRRIKKIGTLPPFNVDIICVIETEDMFGLENQLHQRYADKRVRGEWFKLEQADVDYVVRLSRAGA